MATREAVDRSLKPGALKEIERSLRGKLKAHGLSEAFIERSLDDALQRGLVEYLRVLDRGEAVDNPAGFVVQAGFRRAIDELRREARQADGTLVDALIDSGRISEPPTDEVAIDYLQAEELREAVNHLSPEEQQVLSLHYFEELTTEASAEALFCSERTYRRRLNQALKKLGECLGVPAPEPGSRLAIEIGLLAWVALRDAKVALAQGPLDQLVGVVHVAQEAAAWAAGRARDFAARFSGGGGGEKVIAVASSGPGRAVGVCVAACALAVGGVELAGVGQGGGQPHIGQRQPVQQDTSKAAAPEPVVTAPPVPKPEPAPTGSTSRGSDSGSPSASASRAEQREQEATEVVRSQQPEAAVVEESAAPEAAPESSSASSGASPTEIANEQFGP